MSNSIVYNLDCMEGMKQFPDKHFALAIVDPPYGINAPNMTMGSNPNRSGRDVRGEIQYGRTSVAQKIKKGRLNSGGGHFAGRNLTTMDCSWDTAVPIPEYFAELKRVSKNQIIFGANYFDLAPTRCMICWDKIQPWDNFSQFELAWTSFDYPAKLFRLSNRWGANDELKIHPTQKPTKLYKAILDYFAEDGDNIFDSHVGSGSHRIAAYQMGYDFTGYEIDKEYFEAAEKRFKLVTSQTTMFQP